MKDKVKNRQEGVIRFEDLLPRESVNGGNIAGKLVFGLRRPVHGKTSAATSNNSSAKGEES